MMKRALVNLSKLRELADFLAKSWSSCSKIHVVIRGYDEVPHVELSYDRIVMPTLSRMKGFEGLSLYDKYRIWRYNLWHESCHIRFNSKELYYMSKREFGRKFMEKYVMSPYYIFLDFFATIFNAIDDYRIEKLGVKEFPGMRSEVLFAKAVYRKKLRIPRNDIEIFAELLLADKVPGGVEIPDYIKSAVEYVKRNVLEDPVRTIVETAFMLLSKWDNPDDASRELYYYKLDEDLRPALIDENVKKISRRELEKEVKEIINESGMASKSNDTCKPDNKFDNVESGDEDNIDNNVKIDVRKVMSGTKIIRQEFRQIYVFRKDDERQFEGEAVIKEADDPEKYFEVYDPALSRKLMNSLARVRRKILEIADRRGEEFDAEEYISSHGRKPFIREVRSRVGGYEVLILADFSGSIYNFDDLYKCALMAIGDALDYLKVPFAVYGFRGRVDAYELGDNALYLPRFKGFDERWNRGVKEKIASMTCNGNTPTGTILQRVFAIASKRKGKVIVMIITDGVPEPEEEKDLARQMIQLYRKNGIKIIGFGLGSTSDCAIQISQNLKRLGLDRSFAVSDLNKLPEKLLTTLLSEIG